MTTEIPLREARDTLGDVVAHVRHTGEPAVITRYGRPEAVLLDVDEWKALTDARDAADAAYVRQRIAADEPKISLSDALVATADSA